MLDQWETLTNSTLGKQNLPVITFFNFHIVELGSWLGLPHVFSLHKKLW